MQLIVPAWFMEREATFPMEAIPELRMLVTSDRVRICDLALVLRAEGGIAMDVSEMFAALDKKKKKESA